MATRDGDLVALDFGSGKQVWRTKIEAGFEGAPTFAPGLVVVPDLEGSIHAFASADGRKLWSHPTEGKSEIKASVAVASGVAVVGSYDGTLHALNLADGSPAAGNTRAKRRSTRPARFKTASPTSPAATAISGDWTWLTGAVKLDVRFGGYTAASPAMSDGLAVFGTFSNDVVAIDLAKKAVVWRYTPKKQFPFYSSAAISRRASSSWAPATKSLHVLDLKTGELRWTFDTQGKIDSSPVILGSVCFLVHTTAESGAWTSKRSRACSRTRQVRLSPLPRRWPGTGFWLRRPTDVSCVSPEELSHERICHEPLRPP